MAKGHSKYTVSTGNPYETLPFETGGRLRGEAYMDVSATLAKDFLDHSKGNRRIRDEYVARLAREMRDGSYSVMTRGKPFKFDSEGYLRDGHHTAFAIIEASQDVLNADGEVLAAGVADVPAGVIWGVSEKEVRMLDTNVDRTYADVLEVDGLPNAKDLAPIIRASIAWDYGYRTDRGHFRSTTGELDERFTEEREYFEKALDFARPILRQHGGVYSPAALRFHLYLLIKKAEGNEELMGSIRTWAATLANDTDPWVNANVLKVVTDAKLAKASGQQRSPYVLYGYQLGLFNESWNRFTAGRTRTKIQLGPLGSRIVGSKEDYPFPEM